MYIKQGEDFTACSLIGMCFPSPAIIWSRQAFITLSFVSPLSPQKITSRQHRISLKWHGSHWRPVEICNSDSNHLGERKGLNIKYPKVQTWSWMIACRVNSKFPLITYLKCCRWFTHPHVAPHWCRETHFPFHRCAAGDHLSRDSLLSDLDLNERRAFLLVTRFNGVCLHTQMRACMTTRMQTHIKKKKKDMHVQAWRGIQLKSCSVYPLKNWFETVSRSYICFLQVSRTATNHYVHSWLIYLLLLICFAIDGFICLVCLTFILDK